MNLKVPRNVVVISVVRCIWTYPPKCAKISDQVVFFLHPVLLKSANNPSNEEVKLFRLMKQCLLRTYSGLNCL